MGHFLFLQNTVNTPKHIAAYSGAHQFTVVDQYDFSPDDLEDADGLLLSQHLDEVHLCEHRETLAAYLHSGGAIALNGPVAKPFLDPPGMYHALPSRAARDWIIEMAEPHPITDGVKVEDLTGRKGVIGFWARGYFKAPDGATILTRFAESQHPADWTWRSAGGGKLLVHPGNDIWGYASDDTTARSIFPQFLNWVTER